MTARSGAGTAKIRLTGIENTVPTIEESPCRLDPQIGPRLPFQRRGKFWVLAGRPTRLAARIVDDGNSRRFEVLDPASGAWREEDAA